jgi:transcription antitermination factor NusG
MATWYALKVSPGGEFRVATLIEGFILRHNAHPMVLEVLSGCRRILRQTKKGEVEKMQPIYGNYIYVKLEKMVEDMGNEIKGQIWRFFKDIPGTLGLLHTKPVSQEELDHVIELCVEQAEVEMTIEKVEQSETSNSGSFDENTSTDNASNRDAHENDERKIVLQNMIQWVTKGKKQIVKMPMMLYNFIDKYDKRILKLLREKGPHFILSAMSSLVQSG